MISEGLIDEVSALYRGGWLLPDTTAAQAIGYKEISAYLRGECSLAEATDNLKLALPALGRRLRGFDWPDALLTAPETRSSAPLRMLRNERRESPIGGLYPLGEGAGYAGGIVSAAVDGLQAGMEA